jgi:uncharacterized protein DUF6508
VDHGPDGLTPGNWSTRDVKPVAHGGGCQYRGPTALRAASVADAARMATFVIRSDRFCEGTIDAAIRDGTFGAILERLLRGTTPNGQTRRDSLAVDW